MNSLFLSFQLSAFSLLILSSWVFYIRPVRGPWRGQTVRPIYVDQSTQHLFLWAVKGAYRSTCRAGGPTKIQKQEEGALWELYNTYATRQKACESRRKNRKESESYLFLNPFFMSSGNPISHFKVCMCPSSVSHCPNIFLYYYLQLHAPTMRSPHMLPAFLLQSHEPVFFCACSCLHEGHWSQLHRFSYVHVFPVELAIFTHTQSLAKEVVSMGQAHCRGTAKGVTSGKETFFEVLTKHLQECWLNLCFWNHLDSEPIFFNVCFFFLLYLDRKFASLTSRKPMITTSPESTKASTAFVSSSLRIELSKRQERCETHKWQTCNEFTAFPSTPE